MSGSIFRRHYARMLMNWAFAQLIDLGSDMTWTRKESAEIDMIRHLTLKDEILRKGAINLLKKSL